MNIKRDARLELERLDQEYLPQLVALSATNWPEIEEDYNQKIEKVLADRDAKIKDAPNAFATKLRQLEAEKKAQVSARTLKWHTELAEKGDSFGLFRMGERYRDGEGVPKDLGKAREYFTKAAAAGSPGAADALSKLNQVSTNSPATP